MGTPKAHRAGQELTSDVRDWLRVQVDLQGMVKLVVQSVGVCHSLKRAAKEGREKERRWRERAEAGAQLQKVLCCAVLCCAVLCGAVLFVPLPASWTTWPSL